MDSETLSRLEDDAEHNDWPQVKMPPLKYKEPLFKIPTTTIITLLIMGMLTGALLVVAGIKLAPYQPRPIDLSDSQKWQLGYYDGTFCGAKAVLNIQQDAREYDIGQIREQADIVLEEMREKAGVVQ